MRTKTFASVAVISALGLLAPIQANAFGLGKIETLSALNEPFKAEVEITALRADDDVSNIHVELASNKEFERAGLERSFLLTQFKFEVIESNGQTKVVISSKQVVKEPFLDFLLTAKTGSGRLIREYTVLLDPPKNIFPKTKVETTPRSTTEPSKKQPASSEYQYTAPSLSTTNVTSYTTERADTLWDIALKTRSDDTVSVQQMMMALLAENPRAFVDNNVNGLKSGYTLLIPSLNIINRTSKQQAINGFKEQNNAWANRNKKAVFIDESVVTAPTSIDKQNQTNDTVSTEDDVAAESVDTTTSRLKLVVPDDEFSSDDSELSPSGDSDLNELSEQLTLAQETIEGQVQETIDMNSRMDVMNEQIQTLRRLISLKDADLARLQSLLEEDGQDISLETLTDEALALLQESENNQQESLDLDIVEADIVDEQIETSIEPLVNEFDVTEMELSSISSLDDAVIYAAELSGVDKDEIQSVMNKIKTFVAENKMESMLGALLLLILLWLLIRRINRPNVAWSDAVEGLDNKEKTSKVDATEEIIESETDDEQFIAADVESEKTVEDLISDADVYVSYDDLAKAKLVLEEAQLQDPLNELVLQKILYVLYKQKQVDEFVDLAEKEQFDKESVAWDEIVGWGRELAPEHTLFKEEVIEVVAEEVVMPEPATPDELEALDINAAPSEIESSELAFNLDNAESSIDDELLSIDGTSDNEELLQIDTLDLDDTKLEDEGVAFDEPLSLDITNDNDELTLDETALILDIEDEDPSIELEELAEITELEKATEELSGNEDDLAFDLDFDSVDEMATKLDLATAYVDMGDAEGARNILVEVLNEGNDEQKTQAQTLLEQLS